MLATDINVGFEDYIIFHRGVAECAVNPQDGHLYVRYQDGTVQDMGDPYGDFINRSVTKAESDIDQYTQDKLGAMETMYQDFSDTKDGFNEAVTNAIGEIQNSATAAGNSAQAAYDKAVEAYEKAEQAAAIAGEIAITDAEIDEIFLEGGGE